MSIETVLETRDTTIARDLRLNLNKLLETGALAPEEALMAVLAASNAVEYRELAQFARAQLEARDVPADHITEAAESAALTGMLNMYYRFRHMIHKDDDYRSAGLRMTALSRPAIGKDRMEMLAFTVSVINGCEACIKGHEEALRRAEISVDKIHDLARIAAVVKGLKALRES